MKVIRKQLHQVSPQLYKQLYALNFRAGGLMRDALKDMRKEKTGVVHYILDGTRLIGWTLFFWSGNWSGEARYFCYFYVRKNERRKGYGRQLFQANRKYAEQMRITFKVAPRNGAAKKFFKKVKPPRDRRVTYA